MGTVRGTPGYFPLNEDLRDGSVLWDVWAFAAIILECDMEANEYKQVMEESESMMKAPKHLERPGVCEPIKKIIRGTLLKKNIEEMMGLDEIMDQLRRA